MTRTYIPLIVYYREITYSEIAYYREIALERTQLLEHLAVKKVTLNLEALPPPPHIICQDVHFTDLYGNYL